MRHRWKRLLLIAVVVVGAIALWTTRDVCVSTWVTKGVRLPVCESGELRAVARVDASRVRRGKASVIGVSGYAAYTTGPADEVRFAPLDRFAASLSVIDHAGHATPLAPLKGWRKSSGVRAAIAVLPALDDGDYTLRATIHGPVGDATVDAPMPLYAPARVHVITDRPLYRPGDRMQFRAVVLRAGDLVPLEHRPGKWSVVDPTGNVLLEEDVPSGAWGVTSGSFPLDTGATEGTWRVRYSTGEATDDVAVEVHPFVLPRFRVEVDDAKSFYGIGDEPKVTGRVVYSSGAPVANAALDVAWSASGAWPPPTEWMASLLPQEAKTDEAGRFTLALPRVPTDLRDQATLAATITAVDSTGDRVAGGARVLLSEDAIGASAVTELPDGLVEGFNNRVFVRVTDAAGNVLAGARVRVTRAWDSNDKGLEATADDDGVAAFQLDPGPAVNVVVPPMPVRAAPPQPLVTRESIDELLQGKDVSLADQRAFDAWPKMLEPCARFVADANRQASFTLRVDRAGRVSDAVAFDSALTRCARAALAGRALSPGAERLYAVTFAFAPPPLAQLSARENPSQEPDGLALPLTDAMADARRCLAPDASGSLPVQLVYRTQANAKKLDLNWVAYDAGTKLPAATTSCIENIFSKMSLDQDATADALGTIQFDLTPSPTVAQERPQATTMLGYEFVVSASAGDRALGTTKLRLMPGTIPRVRLRASPVLATAGGVVAVELLRGPGFEGALPKQLELTNAHGVRLRSDLDSKTHVARFTLPADAEGWYSTTTDIATARVYVRPRAELAVRVASDKPRYAPGDTAKLTLTTTTGGVGHPAAVGLFGVDESLAQLATLPDVDDFDRVRPTISMNQPAFDDLDAQALSMGRVTGENAAAAIVLRAGEPQAISSDDAGVDVTGALPFDASGVVVDHFYGVLGELDGLVADWEKTAPKAELMRPRTMAALWRRALDAAAKKGEPITDAYGRRLTLSRLPMDLLSLVDPRQVVVDGTRLPEDVESWSDFVAKEQP